VDPGNDCDPNQGTPAEKSVKGPFGRYQKELRGRLTLIGNGDTQTRKLKYDVCHRDAIVWKYEVDLRDKEGKDLDVLDPMTVGKGEGN
jgi:hypothetical protein